MNPDPLTVFPDPADCPKCGDWRDGADVDCACCGYYPPDLTDVATHATGWYLSVLVAVAAALLVVLYGWSRA